MKTLFADSFFYFALLNPTDLAHEQAEAFLESFDGKLVTTAWILTELADGMADPADRQTFIRLHEALGNDPDVTLVPPDPALFADGLALYASRPDKEWSLTDCISFVVMQRDGLTEALTGDHHFEQAGFKPLLK